MRRDGRVEEERAVLAYVSLAERRAWDIAVVWARKLRFGSSNCGGGTDAV